MTYISWEFFDEISTKKTEYFGRYPRNENHGIFSEKSMIVRDTGVFA